MYNDLEALRTRGLKIVAGRVRGNLERGARSKTQWRDLEAPRDLEAQPNQEDVHVSPGPNQVKNPSSCWMQGWELTKLTHELAHESVELSR